MPCPRCRRNHSPRLPCGIPPRTTLHSRVGLSNVRHAGGSFEIKERPKSKKRPSTGVLEKLLEMGLKEEQKCLDILKALPPDIEEYEMVMIALEKVRDSLMIIRKQLTERG